MRLLVHAFQLFQGCIVDQLQQWLVHQCHPGPSLKSHPNRDIEPLFLCYRIESHVYVIDLSSSYLYDRL